jgi:hypothetical protein
MNDDQFIYNMAFEWAKVKDLEELYKIERSKNKFEKWIAFRAIQIKQYGWKQKDWQRGQSETIC